jgi:predicted DNA-binding protein with PD1-like motif
MNMIKRFLSLSALLISTAAFADQPAAVDKHSCSQLIGTEKPFILVLNAGDEILSSISACAKDAKLLGASISGLGQLHDPTLAYFTSNPKDKPTLTQFKGYFELASLNGNVAKNKNGYYTHAHAVLANQKFNGIAGHVNNAKVGLTVEVTITPLPSKLQREVDPETGFGSIVTSK